MRTNGESLRGKINDLKDLLEYLTYNYDSANLSHAVGLIDLLQIEVRSFFNNIVLVKYCNTILELFNKIDRSFTEDALYDRLPNDFYTISNLKPCIRFCDILIRLLAVLEYRDIGSVNKRCFCVDRKMLGRFTDESLGLLEFDLCIIEMLNEKPHVIDSFLLNYKSSENLILNLKNAACFCDVNESINNYWIDNRYVKSIGFTGDLSYVIRKTYLMSSDSIEQNPYLLKNQNANYVLFSSINSLFEVLCNNKWVDIEDFKTQLKIRFCFDYGNIYNDCFFDLNWDIIWLERELLSGCKHIMWLDNKNYDQMTFDIEISSIPRITFNEPASLFAFI